MDSQYSHRESDLMHNHAIIYIIFSMKAVLIGNLTIDENIFGTQIHKGAGGSVYFLAKTFENLGVSSTIVSPYGTDFPKESLSDTHFIPIEPEFKKTLLFKNNYSGGKREQEVANYKQYLNYKWNEKLKLVDSDADILMIAPVLNNIDAQEVTKIRDHFPKSFFCLLPQGFYRQIGNQDKVYKSYREIPTEIIKNFDFICLSVEDITDANAKGIYWSKRGPAVIITRAGEGSSLYTGGNIIDTNAYYVPNIADPTGAGDIFAGAFTFAYLKSKDLNQSMLFANAAAAISLRVHNNPLQYSYQDIINFAASQKRPIKL